ncbi:TadE family type IV pilus minor pilin [Catenulispora subtropica]|uniref:TadE-like domain-containing protein n=1 Tax=Catenulispora subtropica TaxID=450798 RepID=A0ABP5C9X9_9ACTN
MRPPRDAGYATVEAALAIPSLLLLTLALAGLLAGMAAQIRCLDAARLGARAVARGEPPDAVQTAISQASPGSTTRITTTAGLIHVAVSTPVAPLAILHAFTVHAEAVEADEATTADAAPDIP